MAAFPLMNTPKAVFRHLAVMLLGIPLAFVLQLCARCVWPEMAWPVFFCVVLWWMLPGAEFFRYEEVVPTHGWMSMREAHNETRFWPGSCRSNRSLSWCEYVCSMVANLLLGFVVAILLAGSLGVF